MLYKLFFVSSVIALSLGDQVNQNKEKRELTATLTRRLLGYGSNNGGTGTRRLLEVDPTRGIIGEDGRTQITSPDNTKWAGIISCPSCTANDEDIHDIWDDCSAALIAPYWVLTAAHCLYQFPGWPNASVFQFHPATINEETFQADPVNVVSFSYYKDSNGVNYGTNDSRNSDYDIAWFKLDRPVGDKYGYLAVGSSFDDTEIMNNVGYPKDKPYPLYNYYKHDLYISDFNEELLHSKWYQHCLIDDTYSEYGNNELIWSPDCDIFHGQSGSPLYTDDHEVVGVACRGGRTYNSSGGVDVDGVATHNAFTRITPEIQYQVCTDVGWDVCREYKPAAPGPQ